MGESENFVCNATNPIFKNLLNILLLLTKTMVQKIKNNFTPLWIGRVKIKRDASKPILKNLSNILILLTETVVKKIKNIFTP